MYNKEMLESMGEIYVEMLKVLNKDGNDPYSSMSDIFPFKCFIMVLKRITPLGIPKSLDKKIASLMNEIDPNEVDKLMGTPVPLELRVAWYNGTMGIKFAEDKK